MNSTQHLTYNIKNNIPCIFAKYGDGEFTAATFRSGHNCDGTPLTNKLGNAVRESIQYISKQPNSMIGKWHTSETSNFWQSLVAYPINYVDYHTVINDTNCINNSDKLDLLRSIKESKVKKIFVGNPLLKKAKLLLNIDVHIEVDYSNWFEADYENIRDAVCNSIESDTNTIIMTSAGIGAKPLISDLHKLYPNAIYIDMGSSLDTICTKRDSRGCTPPYNILYEYFKPIIPPGWESEDYIFLYDKARITLGKHLH